MNFGAHFGDYGISGFDNFFGSLSGKSVFTEESEHISKIAENGGCCQKCHPKKVTRSIRKQGPNPAFSDVRFYSVLLKKELKVIL